MISRPAAPARGRGRTKPARAAGRIAVLPWLQSAEIATYTSKRGRRFRSMLPKGAPDGWDSCAHQASPAAMLEESVVFQLRSALSSERPAASLVGR